MNTTTTTDTITEILTAIYGPVDPQQSLSHLGIDSMTAVRLQREIHHATGIYLPLITFIGDATVATLARAVDNAEPAALALSPRANTACAKPPPATSSAAGPWVAQWHNE